MTLFATADNSSNKGWKRDREEDNITNIIQKETKRSQHRRIHSEVHNYTITTMMNSSKYLQKYVGSNEDHSDLDYNSQSNKEEPSIQKPYWPVISKLRTDKRQR